MNDFSKRITELRRQKGISCRKMSLIMGLNENYISKIEQKKSLPSMTVFFDICNFFDISPKDFFEDEVKYSK